MTRGTLLSLLRCPVCRAPLGLQSFVEDAFGVAEGSLRCACGRWYPIIAGIPRFVEVSDRYREWFARYDDHLSARDLSGPGHRSVQAPATVDAFGFEWKTWDRPYTEATLRRVVLDRTQLPAASFAGRVVLDAGCGAGYQSRYMTGLGASVVGADLAAEAAGVAWRNLRGQSALVIQADLARLPFAPATFDLVYSEGVIHHTADPRRTFRSLAALVRPGGHIAAGLYHRPTKFSPVAMVKDAIRSVCSVLPPWVVYRLCWLHVPLAKLPGIGRILVRRGMILEDPDDPSARKTWMLNYDWYAPHAYQYYFSQSEVRAMFEDETLGLEDIVEGDVNFLRARRRA